MTGRLHNKVAIITGGNSGIGEATAHLFAREGAKVALLARRETEGLAVQQTIRDGGGNAIFIQCDVSDSDAVDAAVAKTVETYGRLNVVINNAGGGAREMFPDETDEAWDRVIGVNLTGAFYMSRAAWGHLALADGGVIINISSGAAVMGFNDALLDSTGRAWASASYFAAKAGLEGFTRYAAGIGAKSNIRVNCVRPGQILTPLTLQDGQHRLKGAFDRVQILDGPGFPEDVANSVLFLASDEARFVTGEIINVDGGLAAKL
jgi:NAD(P)-dependent dehydrogenase (short-subunit alcohol dehydrogenase family)